MGNKAASCVFVNGKNESLTYASSNILFGYNKSLKGQWTSTTSIFDT